MKARGAMVQGGLAALGLVAAYVTWQRPPEKAVGEVKVLNLSRSDVEKGRYDDGTHWVEVMPGHGEQFEPKVWVRTGSRPTPLPTAVDAGTALASRASR